MLYELVFEKLNEVRYFLKYYCLVNLYITEGIFILLVCLLNWSVGWLEFCVSTWLTVGGGGCAGYRLVFIHLSLRQDSWRQERLGSAAGQTDGQAAAAVLTCLERGGSTTDITRVPDPEDRQAGCRLDKQ